MKILVKKITDTAKLPTHGSDYAAGYDLYADIEEPIYIAPHETIKISTGLSIAIPQGYFGAIFARSGLAVKKDLLPANATGIIDADYRGSLIVALHNNNNTITREVKPGDRIAQLIILPYQTLEFENVQELDDTVRGDGGFGSTGEN